MTERFVEVPGARLFVIDEGVGPPIILLHAGVADLRSWDALAPLLVAAGLKQRFIATVIVWNVIAYPAAVAIWVWLILSMRSAFVRLRRDEEIADNELDPVRLKRFQLPTSCHEIEQLRAISEAHKSFCSYHARRQVAGEPFKTIAGKNLV